ncbi:MAG TPA: formate--tetrahydrofolate ligase, partial [Candidatus Altiarchaeales archaeon]|nr:formate--tetrahydrofolate ligase [Candidatus Altiarchaeales archaeon]
MKSDIDLAHQVELRPIVEVAKELGLEEQDLMLFGRYKAKIPVQTLQKLKSNKDGKLVLVTSMTPTKAGEGKTTTTVGLTQALRRVGEKATLCVREPSLGPVMGLKGGATGGGMSQVLPMEDINLYFTGDIPAVSSANDLCAAVID